MHRRDRPSVARSSRLAWLAAPGLLLIAWFAISLHRNNTDPGRVAEPAGTIGWILGPSAASLADAASVETKRGIEVLNDVRSPAPERLARYRAQLERAEGLLLRSLRAQPTQARSLAQLAAVRWELDPPRTQQAAARHLDLIHLAAEMAPRVPRVHKQLGELLLNMGRWSEATAYLRRSVELDSSLSVDVVGLLRDHLFTAGETLDALGPLPEVLLALERPFSEEAREADYAEALEQAMRGARAAITPGFLASYGNTVLRLRDPERLLQRMDSLGPLPGTKAECGRLIQRSRALQAMGMWGEAVGVAREALGTRPDAAEVAEFLGWTLGAAGDHSGAIQAFRDALGMLARGSTDPVARARLYRQIGEREEARGEASRAYEAYRKAVQLNPEENDAARRLRQMEAAAGLSPDPDGE